jgi:hypothetical protein
MADNVARAGGSHWQPACVTVPRLRGFRKRKNTAKLLPLRDLPPLGQFWRRATGGQV